MNDNKEIYSKYNTFIPLMVQKSANMTFKQILSA